ncbi:MAG: ADP-ribosylglycohydrolase family protein [Acidimicrobiia bacterium]
MNGLWVACSQAIGDALGAAVEFDGIAEIRRRFGPAGLTGYAPAYGRLGAITDDTQMTLFTADGLLRPRPGAIRSRVMRRFTCGGWRRRVRRST